MVLRVHLRLWKNSMKPIKVNTLHTGFLKVQEITVENPQGSQKIFERVVHKPAVIGLCHDPINDKVMLVSQYRLGAMRHMLEFPAGLIDKGEDAHQAVARELLEETGVEAKSTTLLHEYMPLPGSCFAPMAMFYVTFDSRDVVDGAVFTTGEFEATTVVLKGAKELIREVEDNQHMSAPIIMGAQYLKLLHRGLVK